MVDANEGAPAETDAVALARDALLHHLVTFVRSLRRQGASIPADATLMGAQALAAVGLDDRERVKIALRASLISREADLVLFEQLFPAFWQRVTEAPDIDADEGGEEPLASARPAGPNTEPAATLGAAESDRERAVETRLDPDGADDHEEVAQGEERTAVYSPSGRSELVESPTGLASSDDALTEPVRALTAALAGLRGRRWMGGGDTRLDIRRALRRSVETGGTVLDLPGRERRATAVRAVLLVDVSRSVLDTVDRGFLVSFIRAVSDAWRRVTVFFFDTSVRDVSEAFDEPTAAAALAALESAEAAWGGGTRIGHAIETVRREHPMLVDRDTVVLVLSDGLEVGEIDVLEREMAWLSRRAAAVLWANPLAASETYEPTCRGMAAALPYLDGLFAFAGPADITEMARQLARHGPGDRVGYEHDPRRRTSRPESDRTPQAIQRGDGRA